MKKQKGGEGEETTSKRERDRETWERNSKGASFSNLFVSPTAFFNPDPTRSSFLINVCQLGRKKSRRISGRGRGERSGPIRAKSSRFERTVREEGLPRCPFPTQPWQTLIEGKLRPLQKWLNSYEARRVKIRGTRLNGRHDDVSPSILAVIIIRHRQAPVMIPAYSSRVSPFPVRSNVNYRRATGLAILPRSKTINLCAVVPAAATVHSTGFFVLACRGKRASDATLVTNQRISTV